MSPRAALWRPKSRDAAWYAEFYQKWLCLNSNWYWKEEKQPKNMILLSKICIFPIYKKRSRAAKVPLAACLFETAGIGNKFELSGWQCTIILVLLLNAVSIFCIGAVCKWRQLKICFKTISTTTKRAGFTVKIFDAIVGARCLSKMDYSRTTSLIAQKLQPNSEVNSSAVLFNPNFFFFSCQPLYAIFVLTEK